MPMPVPWGNWMCVPMYHSVPQSMPRRVLSTQNWAQPSRARKNTGALTAAHVAAAAQISGIELEVYRDLAERLAATVVATPGKPALLTDASGRSLLAEATDLAPGFLRIDVDVTADGDAVRLKISGTLPRRPAGTPDENLVGRVLRTSRLFAAHPEDSPYLSRHILRLGPKERLRVVAPVRP